MHEYYKNSQTISLIDNNFKLTLKAPLVRQNKTFQITVSFLM